MTYLYKKEHILKREIVYERFTNKLIMRTPGKHKWVACLTETLGKQSDFSVKMISTGRPEKVLRVFELPLGLFSTVDWSWNCWGADRITDVEPYTYRNLGQLETSHSDHSELNTNWLVEVARINPMDFE